jgi:hypothetical protein
MCSNRIETVVLHKSVLHRMQIVRSADTFNRCDLGVLLHHGKRQAVIDPTAVHMDCAGTALAMVATFLGPGQMQGLAQRVQQGSSWIGLDRMRLAIHPKRTGDCARNLCRCGFSWSSLR